MGPDTWYWDKAGERTVSYGDKKMQVGEVRRMKGQPATGWQDGTGATGRVFVALTGRYKDARKLRLGTINLQGFGHSKRAQAARWLHAANLDWAMGTEPQVAEIRQTRFAGYAVKATCLAPEDRGAERGVSYTSIRTNGIRKAKSSGGN